MDISIFLTESAKKHFTKITSDKKIISLGIKRSGCSGFSYVLKTIDDCNEINREYLRSFQEIPFLINNEDFLALNNLVIDYKKDGLNYKIVFDNPNSTNECGCGESFSLKRI